jgi:hypothetical protein
MYGFIPVDRSPGLWGGYAEYQYLGPDAMVLRVPDGPYVRNDSGCYEGAAIPVHYDPMISKLVVWGEDRARALARAGGDEPRR